MFWMPPPPPPSAPSSLLASKPVANVVGKNTLVFKVTSQLNPGESLSLVGSVAELGAWSAEKGVPMTWSEGNVWTAYVDADAASASASISSSSSESDATGAAAGAAATPSTTSSSSSSVIEFKLVRVNEGSGQYTWLEGDNYRVELAASGEVISTPSMNTSVQDMSVEMVPTADLVVVVPESSASSKLSESAEGLASSEVSAMKEEEMAAFQAEVEAARKEVGSVGPLTP